MKKKRWVIDLLLTLIIIIVGTFVVRELDLRTESGEEPIKQNTSTALTETENNTSKEEIESLSSESAKNFELENLAGEIITLSDYSGQPVMVNFWATWCPPCREEMPLFQKFADIYDTRLVILAVNAGETEEVVRNFVEETGLNLVFLLDPSNLAAELYGVRGFPTTLFIDEQGTLVATHVGGLDESLITYYLEMIGLPE